MDAAMKRFFTALAVGSVGLWLLVPWAIAQKSAGSGEAEITGLQLRKDGGELSLTFLVTQPVPMEVVGNLPLRVLVVKFSGAQPAFPDGKTQFIYNDPLVIGVSFDALDEHTTWAKIRLRTPDVIFQLRPDPGNNRALLTLKPSPTPVGVELTGLRMATQQGNTRVVLELSRLPTVEERVVNSQYVVRLKHAVPRLRDSARGEDERVSVAAVERDGTDTVVRFQLKRAVRVSSQALNNPARLLFTFRPTAEDVAQGPAGPSVAAQPGESLPALLAAEPEEALRANYQAAERELKLGNFARAEALFTAVYNAAPRRRLGIRAAFRAADARFEILKAAKATNLNGLIAQYQSAIRSAEAVSYESDQIPRAFFQIGRAYQLMNISNESNTFFRILQQRFPAAAPYAVDSFFYVGENQLALRQYDEAIASFRKFLDGQGSENLTAAAYYSTGDTLYNLQRPLEAKHEFDRARRLDPDYPNAHPLLLFHIGESYYETADFDTARLAYRQLLERYPERVDAKLVGLRLGDFLRDEGKEPEALTVYDQIAHDAPPEILMRAKMRIAGVLANHPSGDDWKKALALYDEILAMAGSQAIAPEVQLRKALTNWLHNQHRAAIADFEALEKNYPHSRFVRENLIQANIAESIRAEVDRLYENRDFWGIVKFYSQYRDKYFKKFRFPLTVFQVARAHHYLGLFDAAIGLYDELDRPDVGTIATLVAYQRALAYADKDDMGRAESNLLRFIEQNKADPYLVDVRMKLGQVYGEQRRYQDAQNAYRLLVRDIEQSKEPELAEAAPEVFFRLGMVHKDLGQNAEALEAFRQVAARFNHPLQGEGVPDYIILSQFFAADLMFELGQNTEAVAAYEQAIARYPEHERAPWARYQIALIYRRTGQEQRALDALNALLELAKTRPGELWEPLARENQRDLASKLQYQDYLRK
jgi:TolA-binding protein